LEVLRETKSVYLYIATFNQPVQPVYLTVKTPSAFEVDEGYAEAIKSTVPDEQGKPVNMPIFTTNGK
jgi:hypothetical protein